MGGEFAGEARSDDTGGEGEGCKRRQRLAQAFNILARAIDAAARLKSAARAMAVMRAKLFMAGSSPRFFLEPLGGEPSQACLNPI
jgi:hypothetical protein